MVLIQIYASLFLEVLCLVAFWWRNIFSNQQISCVTREFKHYWHTCNQPQSRLRCDIHSSIYVLLSKSTLKWINLCQTTSIKNSLSAVIKHTLTNYISPRNQDRHLFHVCKNRLQKRINKYIFAAIKCQIWGPICWK